MSIGRPLIGLAGYVLLNTIVFAVAGAVLFSGNADPGQDGANPSALVSLLALVATQGLTLWLWRRRMATGKLTTILAIFGVVFGMGTLLPQIETFVFLDDVSAATLRSIVFLGLLASVAAAATATFLFNSAPHGTIAKPRMQRTIIALVVIAALYPVLYLVFGYYVVWVDDAARLYYDGGELVPFLAHVGGILRTDPGFVFGLQLGRGAIFALLFLIVARTMTGSTIRLSIVLTLILFAFGVMPLILPNALMPDHVRMLHLVEMSLTALVYAPFAGFMLRRGAK